VRGDVERAITTGIRQTFDGDHTWHLRAKKLMRLRNELLHGGSSSIDNWNQLGFYLRHFRSDPLRDVGVAAMTALTRFFDLPIAEPRTRNQSRLAKFRRFTRRQR
jgi:hypothetical protein